MEFCIGTVDFGLGREGTHISNLLRTFDKIPFIEFSNLIRLLQKLLSTNINVLGNH